MNIKFKIIFPMIILILFSIFLPNLVLADYTIGDFQIEINSDNTVTINKYHGTESDLTIPDTIDERVVTNINDYAFSSCNSLINVIMPDTIVSMGMEAFLDCQNLTSIKLSENIDKIEVRAFSNCSSLENINIPNSVTYIDYEAFYCCKNLATINIPENVVTMSAHPFKGCKNLININVDNNNSSYCSENGILYNRSKTSIIAYPSASGKVIIPDTITNIGDWAFSLCENLISVEMSDSVTTLSDFAFSECKNLISVKLSNNITKLAFGTFSECFNLTNIIIPNSVIFLDSNAFYKCTNLVTINIPENVVEVGSHPFIGCINLENINVDANNKNFSSENGILYNKNKTSIIAYPSASGKIIIQDTVVSIETYAFYLCENLTSVEMTDSVTTLSDSAFCECKNLISVKLSNNITKISTAAFSGCNNLTNINIPNSVSSIERFAFSKCYKLENIIIPSSVINMGYSVFYEDTNIVIHGYKDSYVQQYAKENNIKFEIIDEQVDPKPPQIELPFTDIKENAFYFNALDYMYKNGYVTGTTKTTFSPNDKLSRAMLVTILWNMEGKPKTSGANKFKDVKNGVWYTDAIVWASTSGVVNGNKDGTFTPNNNITRQEVAVMLCNYAKYKGKNVTSNKDLSAFKDNSKVASWALPSMRWAIENKVIGGAENGTKINPVNNATRAEAVTMIKNYIDNVK